MKCKRQVGRTSIVIGTLINLCPYYILLGGTFYLLGVGLLLFSDEKNKRLWVLIPIFFLAITLLILVLYDTFLSSKSGYY